MSPRLEIWQSYYHAELASRYWCRMARLYHYGDVATKAFFTITAVVSALALALEEPWQYQAAVVSASSAWLTLLMLVVFRWPDKHAECRQLERHWSRVRSRFEKLWPHVKDLDGDDPLPAPLKRDLGVARRGMQEADDIDTPLCKRACCVLRQAEDETQEYFKAMA